MLLGGAIMSVVLAFAGALILPPLNLANAAPDWQISPLSPLTSANAATSVTTSVTTTVAITPTTGLITSTIVTASEPLPADVITATVVDITAVAPVEMTSPLTVSTPVETPGSVAGPKGSIGRPIAALWSFPARLAGGQISLLLVAVLFVGLFTVTGLVLTRRS